MSPADQAQHEVLSRPETASDELTDTGVIKLQRAYADGTARIVAHFESFCRSHGERVLEEINAGRTSIYEAPRE